MGIRDIAKGKHFRQSGLDAKVIEDLVERGYMSQVRETKIAKKETFAPSSIGYDGNARCPRYWYMAFEGKYVFEETTDAMGMATMMNGRYAGERFGEVFEASGSLVALEVEMKMENPPIRGYIDALIRIRNEETGEDEIVVGEFKTTRSEMFIHRENTMKPLPYHLYQILLYMKATGKKNGFLFYENRNDLSFLVIPVEMNEENEKILEDALEWLREVRANWEAEGDTLPTRPFTQKSKQCKTCPVFNECWNNLGEGSVTIKPMVVAKP
jgi:CRISPR/Cas system-associated exonuclease Cas4 (RecB family)